MSDHDLESICIDASNEWSNKKHDMSCINDKRHTYMILHIVLCNAVVFWYIIQYTHNLVLGQLWDYKFNVYVEYIYNNMFVLRL